MQPAGREWSGLINQYYYKRWEMFYQMLGEHLENGTDYSEDNIPMVHGREAFRANEFYNRLADWEISWVKRKKEFTPDKDINELAIVKILFKKYKDNI